MSNVNPKVTASTTAAAVTTLVLYFLNLWHVVAKMDDVTKGALGVLITLGATLAAGYVTPSDGGAHRRV